jgi:hypothetical protein
VTFPDDDEFEEVSIASVRECPGGWEIKRSDGWSFLVERTSPVVPRPGMRARFYGRGIGFRVRGLFLDDAQVFYRTDSEDDHHFRELLYGKDCAELLRRWDAGRCIHTVVMGGLGPGYEQAIQVAMIEILRWLLAGNTDHNLESLDRVIGSRDDIARLGLSGAQWDAAKYLAFAFWRKGPAATVLSVPQDRRIQASRDFPALARRDEP